MTTTPYTKRTPWKLFQNSHGGLWVMTNDDSPVCEVQTKAEGLLIAAAPALLEALGRLVDAHDAGIPLATDSRWSQARAVINNAKGRD